MSGVNPSGPAGYEPPGRARRGPGWAQLGRRGEAPAPAEPSTSLRAVSVRGTEQPAEEHHLGERLSAFVDGELGHDSRERVQAHLATCPECLAEADDGRAVKHLLTHTGTPGPSATLMSRLLAVAALPDDEQGGGGPGATTPGPLGAAGTIGGSRLTGGSFGRGAGASFGAGALGAQAPLPGVDPRAGRAEPGSFFGGRRSGAGAPQGADGRGQAERGRPTLRDQSQRVQRPLAALLQAPAARPAAPRARRFVFAAAGAFSVAAVTLGGVGSISALTGEEQHGTAVNPVRVQGGAVVVPGTGELSVDFPVYPVRGAHGAGAVPPAPYGAGADAYQAEPKRQLR
ncbi:anti-sigma factor [Kitasatospora sp. MAP5-34]|uniref:anti-sigma factor n=1 Tax=Kitasatospora sp. MAP5-34 TaxID=3035102 RepID=UPI00247432F2|nr:anti-sigma factor [Kitasatospora sp. MAP5-34]MDH6575517.1 anti-sigma factor RsiW [Kitasatospora sp. MAP5-34]